MPSVRTDVGAWPNSVDIAVIGGGPAGLATAIAAARQGLQVAILERQRYDRWRPGEMLSPSWMPLAQQLGIWPQFMQQKFRPSPGILSFWDSHEPVPRDFIQSPYGSGWSIERPAFDRWLAQCACDLGACVITDAQIHEIKRGAGSPWQLEFSAASATQTLYADGLVDATGSVARIARLLGARQLHSDQMIALVAHLPELQRIDSRLMLEACEGGWWYCLAQPSGGAVVTLITDAELLQSSGDEPLKFWQRQLQTAPQTGHVVASSFSGLRVRAVGVPVAWLSDFAADDWLAVGDAAISFDPLSASGIQRAIESGLRATGAIVRLRQGCRDELTNYINWQQQSLHHMNQERHLYYAMVTRWPQSGFWTRRRAAC